MADTFQPPTEYAAAPVSPTDAQDDNVEMVDVRKDTSYAAQSAETTEAAKEDKAAAGNDDDDDEEEDEEYEIEDILGHELRNGQYRYLVSWVGYGPEHNSWTLERDFGSTEIIDDYWNKKGGRPAPNSASKSKRKSATTTTNSKRKSSSRTPQTKRQRSASPTRNGNKVPVLETEEPLLGEMAAIHKDSISKYKDLLSWEEHVQKISTVERGANNRLVVYMIMADGSRTAQDSAVVHARCPQKMLEFYEAHLRWRHVKN